VRLPATDKNENKFQWISALTLSCLTVSLLFAWQGNVGFNLWDEGYLWYGVQRTLNSEVPIRDFMAYDPGRYYWSAALAVVLGGSSIMHVRIAVAVFQTLGLLTGLLLIAQSSKSRGASGVLFLAIVALTLAIWMFPRHKLFDMSLSLLLVGALALLVRRPTPWRYFAVGVAVGLVAVFGRNHGVYGTVGSFGVMLWLCVGPGTATGFVRGALLWGAGVVIGFLPIILMLLFVPGFGTAFWESVRFLFQQNATNLPLPIPWPWTVDFAASSLSDAIRALLVGLTFVAVLAFGWLGAIWALAQRFKRRRLPPVFISAVFLAIPYAHYAFSRADIGHLAQGIFPMLVGFFVIVSTLDGKVKWVLSAALCATSLWIMSVQHPGWQCMVSGQCVDITVSGSVLKVDPATANDVALLRHLSDQYAADGRSFVATPFWPGAYALLNRRSPTWEIYALFPRQEDFERHEIERINASSPGFILVLNLPLDGRDELRFQNTHPLTYKFILDNFERIPFPSPPGYEIYKSKSVSP